MVSLILSLILIFGDCVVVTNDVLHTKLILKFNTARLLVFFVTCCGVRLNVVIVVHLNLVDCFVISLSIGHQPNLENESPDDGKEHTNENNSKEFKTSVK